MKLIRRTSITLLLLLTAFLVGCTAEEEQIKEVVEETNEVVEEIIEEDMDPIVEIEDMSGRTVEIPSEINTVFGSNNNSSIILYTLTSDKMVGWNLDFSDKAKQYLKQETIDLPVLGNLYGNGKQANIEEIIALNPDIVLLTDVKISDKVVEAADDLQSKLGIPVVVVHANLHNFDEAYEFLGEVIGAEEKADELSQYYKAVYDKAVEISVTIEEKTEIYYARMDNGLTTEFTGSSNAELIELVGGINIAQVDGGGSSGEVTIEQVLEWNPEVILVGHKGAAMSKAYDLILTDEIWAEIDAVKEGNVISVPRFPFNWFDRPPSVNRILGIMWLGNELYPDEYDYDINTEVKEFFTLFYGCELTDEDVEKLIG